MMVLYAKILVYTAYLSNLSFLLCLKGFTTFVVRATGGVAICVVIRASRWAIVGRHGCDLCPGWRGRHASNAVALVVSWCLRLPGMAIHVVERTTPLP